MASKMATRTIAPYGTWKSPITPELLTTKSISFGELATLSQSKSAASPASHLIFIENRPSEKGRAAVVRWPLQQNSSTAAHVGIDVTQGNHNARSGIHEYGGGAVAASSDGTVIFTDYTPGDWGVYRIRNVTTDTPSDPERITPQNAPLRYGGFVPHPTKPHLILAIQEDHTIDEPSNVVNTLVLIDADKQSVTTLQSGRDFYSFPAWSPGGDFVAWVTWQHPSMPFWETEGWVARFEESHASKAALVDAKAIAGTAGGEVVHHPVWLPRRSGHNGPDTLILTSDRTSFSNPYRISVEASGAGLSLGKLKAVLRNPIKADFIKPQWTLGNSHFVPLDADTVACVLVRGSTESLALLHVSSGKLKELLSSYISFGQLRATSSTSVAAVAAKSNAPSAVVIIDLSKCISGASTTSIEDSDVRIIKASSDLISSGQIPASLLSIPEDIEFPTTLSDGTPTTAFGILYPPTNPEYTAPKGAAPPCIFRIHGGPTSAASKSMSLQDNYWTSRGYSICYVNYGGSTGYGREYMLRLMDKWGLVDVLDCCAAAKFLGSRLPKKNVGKQVEEMTVTAQAQWKVLEEQYDSSGSIRITLKNHKKQWSLLDAVALPATAALTSCVKYLAFSSSISVFAAPLLAAAYIILKSSSVLSEAVFASPTLGLQLETTRGLQLPCTWLGVFFKRTTVKHIPRDQVLDVVLNTAVKGWNIRDYLAVIVRSQPRGSNPGKAETVNRGVEVLFPQLEPRLPIVERIYKAIYPVLFLSSSNPVDNAASVPPLARHVNENVEAKLGTPRIKEAIISGGSAGGFTVLSCLTKQQYVFAAGCSSYGMSDLRALAEECHKFESNYPFRLLGGTPDEVPHIYHDRSPLYSAGEVRSPVLMLQGSEDKVVPPNQAHMMVEGIRNAADGRGTERVKYIEFKGEGHGFRQADNIITALKEEEKWYLDTLNLART